MAALGKIKEVDLREVLKDEARDLTPWLAKEENLQALSEEIGIPIKLIGIEANVGKFNVDILAEEETTEKKIVIENQLETTDHDHLGKIITYASGHNAGTVIWIFRNIRDEHKQAIEWLNEHFDEAVDFFAIKLQLWKIDDSKPAPKFEIIVSPNEWTKAIRQKAQNKVTDLKLQQLEFWNRFKLWMQTQDPKMRLRTPRPQHWYNISMGSAEAHIALTVNTQVEALGCEIYIRSNKDLFYFLKEKQEIIEKEITASIEWIDASKASRIKTSTSGFDILNQTNFDKSFYWLYNMLSNYKKIFSEHFDEYRRHKRAAS